MDPDNAYRSFIRHRYHLKRWRQYHVADHLGIHNGSLSNYLLGRVRTPRDVFDQIAGLLELTERERAWLWIAHELLHADPLLQGYVRTLERSTWATDQCDSRLDKLGALVTELRRNRTEVSGVEPFLIEREPSSAARPAVGGPRADDDETHGDGDSGRLPPSAPEPSP